MDLGRGESSAVGALKGVEVLSVALRRDAFVADCDVIWREEIRLRLEERKQVKLT